VAEEASARIDVAAAHELAALPGEGVEVTVYLGTWCSDSRREVGRFWRALDEDLGMFPFAVRYLGIDRSKAQPAEVVAGGRVTHLPTFVVSRDGRELGRIVEASPHGIERDLADLLAGRAHGFLSATQAAPDAPPAPPTPGG
jgi:hypothetical protein